MKIHKTRRFPKAEMLHLINGGSNESYEIIHQELIDHSRWSVTYEIIFLDKATDEYFRAYYNEGATEYQDESPWEWEDEVTASYVEPIVVSRIEYQPVEIDA